MINGMASSEVLGIAKNVIEIEIDALKHVISNLDNSFILACNQIISCKAKVIVSGVGKSGHIANKIAATLASTGTPAFFVHPGDAMHGDLGMISANDVIIFISNSGESLEINHLLPSLRSSNNVIICMSSNKNSTLAKSADIFLDISVPKEACALNLAPTASTTAALALGDALAIALLKAKGFTANDFAKSHPGGKLGRRLSLRVKDIMHTGARLPNVDINANLIDAIIEISNQGLGMTAITDGDTVVGIFTDGDLRRLITKQTDIQEIKMLDILNKQFKSISQDELAINALDILQNNKINGLLVLDKNRKLVGAFNMHDLMQVGII